MQLRGNQFGAGNCYAVLAWVDFHPLTDIQDLQIGEVIDDVNNAVVSSLSSAYRETSDVWQEQFESGEALHSMHDCSKSHIRQSNILI